MALILELRTALGAPTWHHLRQFPVSIGRSLRNDVIVADPYTEANHATIVEGADGTLELHDLGSTNGLRVDGKLVDRVALASGTEVRVGRSMLRFHDLDMAIAPALVDHEAAMEPGRREFVARTSVVGKLAVIALALFAWSGTAALRDIRRPFNEALGAYLIVLFIVLFLWSLFWAAVARGSDRKVRVMPHLMLGSVAALAGVAIYRGSDLLEFLYPAAGFGEVMRPILMFALIATLIRRHLALGNLFRKSYWIFVGGSVVALIALGMIMSTSQRDKFSDVPKFSARLEPLSDKLTPAGPPARVADDMTELKRDADALLKESAKD